MKQKKLEQFGWNRIDFFMKQSWFKLKWLKTRRKRGDFTESMEFFSNYWEIINQTLLQKPENEGNVKLSNQFWRNKDKRRWNNEKNKTQKMKVLFDWNKIQLKSYPFSTSSILFSEPRYSKTIQRLKKFNRNEENL